MSHFPNTLPAFVKLLIDFPDNYRRKCNNIDPWWWMVVLMVVVERDFSVKLLPKLRISDKG